MRKKREKLRENLREIDEEMCKRDKQVVFRNFISSFIGEMTIRRYRKKFRDIYAPYKKVCAKHHVSTFVRINYLHEFFLLYKLIGNL